MGQGLFSCTWVRGKDGRTSERWARGGRGSAREKPEMIGWDRKMINWTSFSAERCLPSG